MEADSSKYRRRTIVIWTVVTAVVSFGLGSFLDIRSLWREQQKIEIDHQVTDLDGDVTVELIPLPLVEDIVGYQFSFGPVFHSVYATNKSTEPLSIYDISAFYRPPDGFYADTGFFEGVRIDGETVRGEDAVISLPPLTTTRIEFVLNLPFVTKDTDCIEPEMKLVDLWRCAHAREENFLSEFRDRSLDELVNRVPDNPPEGFVYFRARTSKDEELVEIIRFTL